MKLISVYVERHPSSAFKQTLYRAAGICSSSPAAHKINFVDILDQPDHIN
jgi:hypothetical protein